MSTTTATLTRRTTVAYTLTLAPCARCGRLYAVTDLVRVLRRHEWRCRNWDCCEDNRAERARIAAALRAEGQEAA